MGQSRAKVRWLSFEEGGRTRPPTGPRYSTVARFAVQKPAEPWSLVLYIGHDANEVVVTSLVDTAPAELFAQGSRFDLFEGEVKVGEGEIL